MKTLPLLSALLCVTLASMPLQANSQAGNTTTQAQAPADKADDAKKPVSTVSPQVAKLIALHPRLVARIEPRGKVCFDGQECDINITVLAPAVEGQARDGESIYKAICQTCHGTGLVGAPKFGDASAWGARLGKGKDTLYNNAINGIGKMPAKGGADISDDEVKNAVDYILSKSS